MADEDRGLIASCSEETESCNGLAETGDESPDEARDAREDLERIDPYNEKQERCLDELIFDEHADDMAWEQTFEIYDQAFNERLRDLDA